ncbi:unnamed protein product [Adineta steineri]|uniref:Pentatricopeptide repeat-containing protein n=1 Tax=Adineta steineri TaxID=433720 RepID=A0A814AL09_9BILA|nr:unnamed protein product [Adineta steineri]
MLIRLLNSRSSSLMIFVRRSIIISSDFDLGMKVKSFNDNRQFGKALDLFDTHKKNNIKTSSTFIITQALKACTHLEDLQRGQTIHHFIPSSMKDNSLILASLIHLYMQCRDVTRAETLYNNNTKEITLPIYGAMIKGKIN